MCLILVNAFVSSDDDKQMPVYLNTDAIDFIEFHPKRTAFGRVHIFLRCDNVRLEVTKDEAGRLIETVNKMS